MWNRLKSVTLWQLVRDCGTAAELTRVREYIDCRCGVSEQTADHPDQRPTFGRFPGLAAKPWHEPERFPWIAGLTDSVSAIRREMASLPGHPGLRPQHMTSRMQGSWNVFYLFALGRRASANCRRCPETVRVVSNIPGASTGGLVLFSSLSPGSHVAAHCGASNARLRCHLGLVIPEGCRIRVGDETRTWSDGGCIVFDDSFNHEVWHDGRETRWVLLIDFWHPDLTVPEQRALTRLNHLFSRERRLRRELLSRRVVP